ncbi:YkgJ family cysteine cluster protein [uncultured Pseudodesulfovibrio sp.]|uniref:YkgJ family cysteine cluster protein n=1 Tax=uncultured Pseudodesulfovibrio sp. TaxID=2035858 RepID=UPI0029C6283F|nr:YkgJ family cysteine cluster protein [uncultured Pseudodesulfovibrio sp.]
MPRLTLLIGLFRRFRAFVLKRDVEVVGQCRMCGRCCREIMLRDAGRCLKTEKQFLDLCQSDPLHECFTITRRDEFGVLIFNCVKLDGDNICTDYESRPALCSNYPTKSLYYNGGWLRDDCGYSFKAVTFRDVFMRRRSMGKSRFAETLQEQIEQEKDKRAL